MPGAIRRANNAKSKIRSKVDASKNLANLPHF
jgi:hypothetical protein